MEMDFFSARDHVEARLSTDIICAMFFLLC